MNEPTSVSSEFGPAGTGVLPATILIAPQAILRQKTRRVRPEDVAGIRGLLDGMFAAMYAAPGIGLAAPQIGVGLRFAVLDLMEQDRPAPLILINPEIIAASTSTVAREEGCLSLPGQYAEVVRPERVRVRYQDLDGARHEIDADGLFATCLQHEIDHLDGILFVDHISALKRNMLMRRLAKEQKIKAGA
ncbi:peptide deformylase [Lichenicoccus sp.]|uniref:peptide deformylase n=1 Tax=Lichenicoccus sp. TaxID=2781899 RepID=UPI003D0F06E3